MVAAATTAMCPFPSVVNPFVAPQHSSNTSVAVFVALAASRPARGSTPFFRARAIASSLALSN